MSASRMISLRVGDGSSNGGDGILGSGDDSSDSGDGDGDGHGGVGAVRHSSMSASMDGGKGGRDQTVFRALRRQVWDKGTIVYRETGGGGIAAVSSISDGSVSSYEGAESGTGDAESAEARCSSSS
ncbi:hypothetical protein Tco_1161095, partial [Tanacetum coccineum]